MFSTSGCRFRKIRRYREPNSVQDLQQLRRPDARVFNPDGWFAKAITDARAGRGGVSEPLRRWLPHLQRSEQQPYSYQLSTELYEALANYDFGSDLTSPQSVGQSGSKSWFLAWNPNRWAWDEFPELVEKSSAGGPTTERWSFASSSAAIGDEVWLVRLGREPRAVCGHGRVARTPYDGPHWDQARSRVGETAKYIDVTFDGLRDPESTEAVSLDELIKQEGGEQQWTPQQSGIQIKERAAAILRKLWYDRGVASVPNEDSGTVMSIAEHLNANHVRQALRAIDADGVPPRRRIDRLRLDRRNKALPAEVRA